MNIVFVFVLLLLVDLLSLLGGYSCSPQTDNERVIIFSTNESDVVRSAATEQLPVQRVTKEMNTSDVDTLRQRPPIPVSLRELKEKLVERREPLPSFKMLPRKAFDDIAFPTESHIPVLMEAFTYCQKQDLMFNSVINLFYLGENSKYRKPYRFSKCTAQLDGVVANDTMVDDPLSRVIVSAFRFPGMCSSQNRVIAITCA